MVLLMNGIIIINRYTDDIDDINGWEVVIKSLNNSSNINEEFLNEVRYL